MHLPPKILGSLTCLLQSLLIATLIILPLMLLRFLLTMDVIHKFSVDNYTPVSLVAVSIPHLMEHLSSSWAYDDLVMVAHNFKLQLESYRQFFQSDLTVIAGLLDPRVKDTFISEGRDDAIEILRKRLASSPPTKNTPHSAPSPQAPATKRTQAVP